jgi:hypothetical protein
MGSVNEYRRCRFCGRAVMFDDERRIAAHEMPPCEGWSNLFAQAVAAGLMQPLSPELHEVPDDLPAPSSTGFAPTEPSDGKEKDN